MQFLRTSLFIVGLACAGTFAASGQDRYESDYRGERYRDRDTDRSYQSRRQYPERDYYLDERRSAYRDQQGEPRTIEMAKLPKTVRNAIRKRSGDADIVRVDQESHRGQVQYRVQTRQNGQRSFFRVASDGTFLGASSDEADWADSNYRDRDERLRSRDYSSDYERRGYDRPRDHQYERGYDRETDYDRYESQRVPRRDSYRAYAEDPYYDGYSRGRNVDSDYERNMRYDDRARYGARNNREIDREWERRSWDDRDFDQRPRDDSDSFRRDASDDRQWSRSRDYDWDRSEGVSRYRDDRLNDDAYYDRRDSAGGRVQEWEEQNIKVSSLPPEVQATIRKHSGSGSITRIDREMSRGQTRYKVQVKQDGKDTFFHVTPTGELVGAAPEMEKKPASDSSIEKPKTEPKTDEKK